MKKLKNQRGILLLCTLVIMVILSILLMVGVYRMESSVMVTKKAIWEIKSYWAAKAGNTIAADGCLKSYNWPNIDVHPTNINRGFVTRAGKLNTDENYSITKNGNVVIGIDRTSDSSFSIYYKNHISGSTSSTVPSEDVLDTTFNNAVAESGEFYALTAGKSGPYISGLEFLYAIDKKCTNYINPEVQQSNMDYGQATSAAAAIYVEKDLTATLDQKLTITQNNGTRGCIVSGGTVSITGSGGKPDNWGSGPVNLDEGAIFANSVTLNEQPIKPSYQSNNLINYSLSVYPNPTVEVNIPPLNKINGKTVPSGTFCFFEMPNEYVRTEYEETINSMMSMYLHPDQFYEIYAQDFTDDNFQNIYNSIKDNDITVTNCSDGTFDCKQIFNDKFDNIRVLKDGNSLNLDDYFKELAEDENSNLGFLEGALSWLKSLFTSDEEEMTPEHKATILKALYKNYLISKINCSISDYRTQAGKSKYEAFFIPQGNAGINTNIHNDNINTSYYSITRARVIGNLKEYCESSDLYSSSTMINVYDGLSTNLSTRIEEEKVKYKENINKIVEYYPDSYYTDKVNVQDGDMFVLNKLSEFDFNSHTTADKFTDAKNYISFDKENLEMCVNCDLEVTEGIFNFATFERRGDTSGMESHAHTYLGDYKQADNERAGIKLLSNGSLTAPVIDILGFVYGRGYIQSTTGDVIFEAVGSGISSGAEDKVSILSNNNIKIKHNNTGASGGTANFKGILYAKNQIEVQVADDNIGFNITGTVICNSMNFNARSLTVKYDPELSGIIISKFVPNWEEQKEELNRAIEEGNSIYTLNPGHMKYFNRI